MSVISLAEAKSVCRIGSGSAYDSPVTLAVNGAEAWVANYLGTAWAATSTIEHHDGGTRYLWLRHWPATAITTVIDQIYDDTTIDADDYTLMDDGRIRKTSNAVWTAGAGRYKVTFTYGYTALTVPDGIKLAMLALIRRAWEGAGQTVQTGQDVTTHWDTLARGEVSELLRPYRRMHV